MGFPPKGFPPAKKDPKAALAEEMSESESESDSTSASDEDSSASSPPAPPKKGSAPNPLMQWAAAYKK